MGYPTAQSYNGSDSRRWESNRGALPVFGVSSYTRAFVTYDEHTKKGEHRAKGGEGGYGRKRCQGERTLLRRLHKQTNNTHIPFKQWLRERNGEDQASKDFPKSNKKKSQPVEATA